jgi:hypothetical protein
MSCEYTFDSGPYVLGALSPAEREAYELHLRGCAECRNAVVELGGVSGLLAQVPVEAVAAMSGEAMDDVPASLLPKLLAVAAADRFAERRRMRGRLMTVAAAAAAVAAVLALAVPAVLARPAAPKPATVAMQKMTSVRSDGRLQAEVALAASPIGTSVNVHCSYGKGGYDNPQRYFLVARGNDGTSAQLVSWIVPAGADIRVPTTTSYDRKDLKDVEIQDAKGQTLLKLDV